MQNIKAEPLINRFDKKLADKAKNQLLHGYLALVIS